MTSIDSKFKNRIMELADRSYQTNSFTFTDFLGIADRSDLLMMDRELQFAHYELFGGYEDADRVLARFGDKDYLGYEENYPITCIHVEPLLKKFADELSHRDFLGALMNLGIERATIGDIKVNEKEAYIFCLDSIADYIISNLDKVKHTSVKVSICDGQNVNDISASCLPTAKQIVVSSLRIDGIIAKVYNISRSDSLNLFQSQKIYINGRLTENNSAKVNANDVINARGYGKFRVDDSPKETRKGRISLQISIW